MKVYDIEGFPNPARVRIALAEKGAADKVDITAFAGLAFADFAKVEIPSELTNLIEWRERVSARPSIAA